MMEEKRILGVFAGVEGVVAYVLVEVFCRLVGYGHRQALRTVFPLIKREK